MSFAHGYRVGHGVHQPCRCLGQPVRVRQAALLAQGSPASCRREKQAPSEVGKTVTAAAVGTNEHHHHHHHHHRVWEVEVSSDARFGEHQGTPDVAHRVWMKVERSHDVQFSVDIKEAMCTLTRLVYRKETWVTAVLAVLWNVHIGKIMHNGESCILARAHFFLPLWGNPTPTKLVLV